MLGSAVTAEAATAAGDSGASPAPAKPYSRKQAAGLQVGLPRRRGDPARTPGRGPLSAGGSSLPSPWRQVNVGWEVTRPPGTGPQRALLSLLPPEDAVGSGQVSRTRALTWAAVRHLHVLHSQRIRDTAEASRAGGSEVLLSGLWSVWLQ